MFSVFGLRRSNGPFALLFLLTASVACAQPLDAQDHALWLDSLYAVLKTDLENLTSKQEAYFSTDPHNGGPYVMWKGTPYAHLMVPIGSRELKTEDKPEAGEGSSSIGGGSPGGF